MSWFIPAFDLWLPVTIAGFALTAAASLAVLLIREPARKIRIIQLAFVGLLVLPALLLLPGYPRVAWWPAIAERTPIAMEAKSPPAKPGATSAAPTSSQPPALPGGSPSSPQVDAAAPEPASFPVDPIPLANVPAADPQPTQPVIAAPIAATPLKTAPSHSTPPAVSAPRELARFTLPSLPDYRLLLIAAYLFGVALLACWWLVGRIAMWRLLRTAAPAEPHVRGLLAEIAATHTGQLSANHVRLLVSPRAAQPCAFGWPRPTIVLPERVVRELTPEQLRLALSHEWSHVARGDIRTWMLAGVVRLVHFHQPLVWLLRRELRISQDYLADAAAAGASTPEDYAELLTTLSRMLRPTPLSPGLGMAPRQSELYRRVVMLVDQSRPLERTIPRRWNVAAVMLGIVLVAGVATLRAEPEDGEPAPVPAESSPVAVDPPGDSEPQLSPGATPTVPSLARPKTRQELLNDRTDRRDMALELVTVGRQLEALLKVRKDLQSTLSVEQKPEERKKIEQHLAEVDNRIPEISQRFVDIQAHFEEASRKEYGRVHAAAADWEHSGDKRRMLEALWAELDQLLKLRDQVFKQAAEQTDSKDRTPYETQMRQIDAKRVEIAQRIEELLQPKSTSRPASSQPVPISAAPAARANAASLAAAPAQQRASEYHFLNRDPIRASRKQLVQRAQELQGIRRQLAETREHLEKLAEEQSRTDEGKKIKPELERLAAQEAQLAEEFDDCSKKIQALPLIPGDILNLEITRQGKDPQTLQRTIPSDGNIVLASESGNIHYYVEGKILAEVGSMIREQLKQLKSLTADDGLIIGYAGHDEGVDDEQLPAEATSSAGAASAKNPELLAKAILHNEPQYVEFQKELSKRQLLLSEQRSSGATREVLDKSQRSVLQLEEHIEEWKAARMPALLELATAYSALDGQRRAATEQTSRAATERGGRASTDSQGRPASGSAPFSGRIRPGDILGIELIGGFSNTTTPAPRTVEPDGNVALGAQYGPASRVKVSGLTLIEAGQEMEKQLKEVLRDPHVLLTYEGHNDGVVAAGTPAEDASTQGKPAPAAKQIVLQPLDTIEIVAPLAKPRIHIANYDGKPGEVFTGENPNLSGTYIIEPDGRIALPDAGGRVKLGGLTEAEASNALREHLAKSIFTRTALPTTRVLRRGRAVFDEGRQPAADYKIKPGDKLLLGERPENLFTYTVDDEGNLGSKQKVHIAGLTLEEAQEAARKHLMTSSGVGFGGAYPERAVPWLLTLGGWREEADPQVIDWIEGTDATQLLRMQEEMQELKAMIRQLQAE